MSLEPRKRRLRRLFQTVLSDGFAKAISTIANVVQVPIALSFLGTEGFGLWGILVGSLQLAGLADLGMALGLQNEVTRAYSRDDFAAVRKTLSTAWRLLACVSISIILIYSIIGTSVDWAAALNVSSGSLRNDLDRAILFATLCFCIGLPLSAAARTATGLQLGSLVSVLNCANSIMMLAVMIVASHFHFGFANFILIASIVPLLANVILMVVVGRIIRKRTSQAGEFDIKIARNIFKSGVLFAIPQACAAVINSAPAPIIAGVTGPGVASLYMVSQRLGTVFLQLQQLPLGPLWPAYAEARGRQDFLWINKVFRGTLIYAIATALIGFVGVICLGGHVIEKWLGNPNIVPDGLLLFATALWIGFVAFGNALAPFLNGMNRLKSQAIAGPLVVVSSLSVMPFAVRSWGAAGAMLSIGIAYGFVNIPLTSISAWRELKILGR